MKTQIKTLALGLATAFSLCASAVSAHPLEKQSNLREKEMHDGPIKIVVSGEVELTIVQSDNARPKFDNNGDENVVVRQNENGLYIRPQNTGTTAKLTVYVKDIFRIDASNGAVVKTNAPLKVKYLQIFLKDDAKADVNAVTDETYTMIKDKSTLALKGATKRHIMALDKKCCITMDQFIATVTEVNSLPQGAELAARN